jgi:Predicted membrane protein
MMILPIILIAGAVYMNKETRLTFVRWVSDSHQIAVFGSLLKGQRNKAQLQPCRVVDNSLNILNERFARGEISEDEYVRVRSALNNR